MAKAKPVGINRAVYDPAIREVIVRGELGEMRSTLARAKSVLKQQGDLKAAITRLERAIKKIET
jgi:uncharacterized protein DUF1843